MSSLLSVLRKVEQYEIAAYRSAAHYAELIGHLPIASRLRLSLEEEQQADNKLKFIGNEVIGFGKKVQNMTNWSMPNQTRQTVNFRALAPSREETLAKAPGRKVYSFNCCVPDLK